METTKSTFFDTFFDTFHERVGYPNFEFYPHIINQYYEGYDENLIPSLYFGDDDYDYKTLVRIYKEKGDYTIDEIKTIIDIIDKYEIMSFFYYMTAYPDFEVEKIYTQLYDIDSGMSFSRFLYLEEKRDYDKRRLFNIREDDDYDYDTFDEFLESYRGKDYIYDENEECIILNCEEAIKSYNYTISQLMEKLIGRYQ